MLNYEKLDHLIVEAIRQPGTHTLTSLVCSDSATRIEADKLHADDASVRGEWMAAAPDRIIDRRLQSLRKRGLICFRAGQWNPGSGE